jgi:hypothetical protein
MITHPEGILGILFKIPMSLKILRVFSINRAIAYMQVDLSLKIIMRIGQLLFFLLFLVHWTGCIWYILVSAPGSWIPPKDLDSGKTNFYDVSILEQYIVVIYYGILLIVGNESAPISRDQIIFSSVIVIMGAIVMAFIFGNMAALITAINKKDSFF